MNARDREASADECLAECSPRAASARLTATNFVQTNSRMPARDERDVGLFQVGLQDQHVVAPFFEALLGDDQHTAAVVVDVEDWPALAGRHRSADPIGVFLG